MKRALSTHLFVNHRLTTVWLDRIWNAGIPLVEIFCARQHLDYRDRAQIAELGHWFHDSELKLHSLHSPMYSAIEVVRRGRVRRAKLYYLRGLSGKKSRIAEDREK